MEDLSKTNKASKTLGYDQEIGGDLLLVNKPPDPGIINTVREFDMNNTQNDQALRWASPLTWRIEGVPFALFLCLLLVLLPTG